MAELGLAAVDDEEGVVFECAVYCGFALRAEVLEALKVKEEPHEEFEEYASKGPDVVGAGDFTV
jgi:hypothetical protein